jgi:hypothetical protein
LSISDFSLPEYSGRYYKLSDTIPTEEDLKIRDYYFINSITYKLTQLFEAGSKNIKYFYKIDENNEYEKNGCYYLKRIVEKDLKTIWTEN